DYGLQYSTEIARALAVDGAGNVYVTGSSETSGSGADYLTVSYGTAGNPRWVARYKGPGNGEDVATGLALDGAGNVYVTGWSASSSTGIDYTTLKYNGTTGTAVWP